MNSAPPLSDLVARAHWHLGMGYFEDDRVLDERGDEELGSELMTCWNCGGEGSIVDCVDDLCHGQDWCMHGDNRMCPECHGEGVL